MADVIEASAEVPVIVDFWAPWCGPCKTLAPALEKAVTEAKGKVRLVKIDVDQNQRIAAQMRVQSIPAVFAFVERPAGGRLPRRAVAGADQGLHRPAGRDVGRQRRARGGAGGGRGDAGRGRGRRRGADLRGDPGRGRGQRRGARRAGAGASGARRDRAGAGHPGAGARRARRTIPAILAARAQIELAEASAGAGEAGELEAARRARPGRPPGALRPRHGAGRQGRPRRGRSTRCSSSSGATASGTTAPPRRSSSSSSTASGRRARRRRRGGGGSQLDDLRLSPPRGRAHGQEVQPRRPAGDDPGLPAARRAAAAAGPAAAEHLRAALSRDARGHAEDRRTGWSG